eukprot:8474626-Pyramimonas_sp.AAC.1
MHAASHRGPSSGRLAALSSPPPFDGGYHALDLGHRLDLGLLFLDLVWTCPRSPFSGPRLDLGPRVAPCSMTFGPRLEPLRAKSRPVSAPLWAPHLDRIWAVSGPYLGRIWT